MMDDTPPLDLSGKILIAMPGMGDPRFMRSVIYMCAHSEEGAMGLIVNKPAEGVRFEDLLEKLEIEPRAGTALPQIRFGGPVEHGRGFVLHSSEYETPDATLQVDGRFSMTATVDVLEDIARGYGPHAAMLALGYSGWGPGQLEDELAANGWLVGEAEDALLFGIDDDAKWSAALAGLGIDPLMLSAEGGRA